MEAAMSTPPAAMGSQKRNDNPSDNITILVVSFALLLMLPPLIAAWLTMRRSRKRCKITSRRSMNDSDVPLTNIGSPYRTDNRGNAGAPVGNSFWHPAQVLDHRDITGSDDQQTYCNTLPTSPICSTPTRQPGTFSPLDPRSQWRTSHPVTGQGQYHTSIFGLGVGEQDGYVGNPYNEQECPYHFNQWTMRPLRASIPALTTEVNLYPDQTYYGGIRAGSHVSTPRPNSGYRGQQFPSSPLTPIMEHETLDTTQIHQTLQHESPIERYESDDVVMIDRPDSLIMGYSTDDMPQRPAPALIPPTTYVDVYSMSQHDFFLGTARTARMSRNDVRILDVRTGTYTVSRPQSSEAEGTNAEYSHQSMVLELGQAWE